MRVIKRFFYNCQKFKLAFNLARFDLLFLLNGISPFQKLIPLARFFVKPSAESFSVRWSSFLAFSSDKAFVCLLLELVEILAGKTLFERAQATERFCAGTVVLRRQSAALSFFGRRLLRELETNDFAAWPDIAAFFNQRLSQAADMRLYASEQAALDNISLDSEAYWVLSTNWPKTSSAQWVVDSPRDFVLTASLSPKAGKNLVRLFAKMLFARKTIVADWERLAVDSEERVAFAGVETICPASYEHRLFALRRGEMPLDIAGIKLHFAIEKLKTYCPETEIFNLFAEYADLVEPTKNFLEFGQEFVRQMRLWHFAYSADSATTTKQSANNSILLPSKEE